MTAALHTNRIGDRSLGAVIAALLESGHVVLLPIGEHRYDLVIDADGEFLRVQVRTGRFRKGCVVFNGYSTNGSSSRSRRYTSDEIDYYGVYCHELRQCYLVPVGDVLVEGRLRVEPTKNRQESGVRMADQYKIPSV